MKNLIGNERQQRLTTVDSLKHKWIKSILSSMEMTYAVRNLLSNENAQLVLYAVRHIPVGRDIKQLEITIKSI